MGGNKNVDNDKKAKGLKYDVSEKAKEAGAAVMEVTQRGVEENFEFDKTNWRSSNRRQCSTS